MNLKSPAQYEKKLLEEDYKDFAEKYEALSEQIKGTLNADDKLTLEGRRSSLKQKMDQVWEKLRRSEDLLGKDRLKSEELVIVLESREAVISEWLTRSLAETLNSWQASNPKVEASIVETINCLENIPRGKCSYSALDEYLARLLDVIEPSFRASFRGWVECHHEGGLEALCRVKDLLGRVAQQIGAYQPALLVSVVRLDEVSTQEGQDMYGVGAWLVENCKAYDSKNPKGVHRFHSPEALKGDAVCGEELLGHLELKVNEWLGRSAEMLEDCENLAEVHVFLPLELLNLPIDAQRLQGGTSRRAKSLGHEHVVTIRCWDRYSAKNRKRACWLSRWKRHQELLESPAAEVLEAFEGDDLDDLCDLLEEVEESQGIIGLQFAEAIEDEESLTELMGELVDAGLPVALWSRCRLERGCHAADLQAILARDCLGQLPKSVKRERSEARKKANTPDCHVGHHLCLLWDDPELVPPKSA